LQSSEGYVTILTVAIPLFKDDHREKKRALRSNDHPVFWLPVSISEFLEVARRTAHLHLHTCIMFLRFARRQTEETCMTGKGYKSLRAALAVTMIVFLAVVVNTSLPSQGTGMTPFGPAVTPGQTLSAANMTNTTPLIPKDVYRTPTPAEQDLATYAWLEFISAVSPVSSSLRGSPGGSFLQSGSSATHPNLVWETYQHRTELLPCNYVSGNATPVAPQPWNSPPKYTFIAQGATSCSTVPLQNYNNLDESTQIGQNYLFFPQTPGNPKPGTDAQVLFEARVNQYEWKFVNANYQNLQSQFSLSFTLPDGTVEVKAAWRPLSSIPANLRYRYHTAKVITYSGTDSSPIPQVQDYALIALHIIHKSPNYPSFVFATFEQVDNLIQQGSVTQPASPTGVYYVPNYASIAYTVPTTTTFLGGKGPQVPSPPITLSNGPFNPSTPYAAPNGTLTALPVGLVTSISGAKTVKVNGTSFAAVPVTQPVQQTSGVQTVNKLALSLMQQLPGFNQKFVWQYYQLAGVQAVPTSNETSNDFYLANNVVESSQPGIQLFRGFPSINGTLLTNFRNQVNLIDRYQGTNYYQSGGCQGCHGVAQTQAGSGFSFLLPAGAAGRGFGPETKGLQTAQTSLARLQRRNIFPGYFSK
jgi:hypothetical protein